MNDCEGLPKWKDAYPLWMSITIMPPFNKQLLVTNGDSVIIAEVHIMTDTGLSWLTRFDGGISAGKYRATHWMELPELPDKK